MRSTFLQDGQSSEKRRAYWFTITQAEGGELVGEIGLIGILGDTGERG